MVTPTHRYNDKGPTGGKTCRAFLTSVRATAHGLGVCQPLPVKCSSQLLVLCSLRVGIGKFHTSALVQNGGSQRTAQFCFDSKTTRNDDTFTVRPQRD
jgi:hypothetical protein